MKWHINSNSLITTASHPPSMSPYSNHSLTLFFLLPQNPRYLLPPKLTPTKPTARRRPWGRGYCHWLTDHTIHIHQITITWLLITTTCIHFPVLIEVYSPHSLVGWSRGCTLFLTCGNPVPPVVLSCKNEIRTIIFLFVSFIWPFMLYLTWLNLLSVCDIKEALIARTHLVPLLPVCDYNII